MDRHHLDIIYVVLIWLLFISMTSLYAIWMRSYHSALDSLGEYMLHNFHTVVRQQLDVGLFASSNVSFSQIIKLKGCIISVKSK